MPLPIRLAKGEAGIFGYGSLLLQSSMETPLGRPYTGERHVCGLRGWRRRWNILYPEPSYYLEKPDGQRCYPENILYLNIERDEGSLNGVMYIVSEADLPDFDRWEWVYDRVDVTCDLLGCELEGGSAWAYTGKPEHILTASAPVEHAAVRA